MIPPELEAKILRLHAVERWPVGTIARQLGVHHTTVRRALVRAGLPEPTRQRRPRLVDPYLPLLKETLQKHPTLPASRLHEMVRQRGYRGGADHFRHVVAMHRPRKPAEAFLLGRWNKDIRREMVAKRAGLQKGARDICGQMIARAASASRQAEDQPGQGHSQRTVR